MTVAQTNAARRKMMARYKGGKRRSVADAILDEKRKALRQARINRA